MISKVMAIQKISISERDSQLPQEWVKRKSSGAFESVLDKIMKAKAVAQ